MWSSVDVLNVAQVPSEIGGAAFPITSSEASNGSQCAIKWSLGWRECRWTPTSAVFFISAIFCACINNKAALFNLSEVPSNPCLTFKSPSNSQEHRADYYAALLQQAEWDAAREPLKRKKKQLNVCLILYGSCRNLQHIRDKVQNKITENYLFSCHFEAQQRLNRQTVTSFHLQENVCFWE